MNVPHPIGINILKQTNVNAIDQQSLQKGLYKAREKTLSLFNEIKNNLKIGYNEPAARKLALSIAADLGARKHWHQPYIRFGAGTCLSFHEPLQEKNIMKGDEPYYLDLGPVWFDEDLGLEFEGDYGETFIDESNPQVQHCIDSAHEIFQEAKQLWSERKISGLAIYQYLKKRCHELGYVLMEDFDGHRISDFPHHQYTQKRLAQLETTPLDAYWILELQIYDQQKRFGAFYEDLLTLNYTRNFQ